MNTNDNSNGDQQDFQLPQFGARNWQQDYSLIGEYLNSYFQEQRNSNSLSNRYQEINEPNYQQYGGNNFHQQYSSDSSQFSCANGSVPVLNNTNYLYSKSEEFPLPTCDTPTSDALINTNYFYPKIEEFTVPTPDSASGSLVVTSSNYAYPQVEEFSVPTPDTPVHTDTPVSTDTTYFLPAPAVQASINTAPLLNINIIDTGNQNYEITAVPPINYCPSSILKCPQCPRTFQKACYLKQHFNARHNGLKPFRCEKCGKKFSNQDKYEFHLTRHTGQKQFQCSHCTKRFHHKSDLNRHVREHEDVYPYVCDICEKGFVRRDHFLIHRQSHIGKSEQKIKQEVLYSIK